jgi:membrane-bound inhibitor of C-type lysozyme
MPPILPSRRALASAIAFAALATSCAAPEKQPDVPSQDTIACEIGGQRIVIRFLPDEVRMLTPDGERVTLQKVPASSGVRYTNGLMEIRGGGGTPTMPGGLQYIREGTAWPLQQCAPLMVPGAPK